MADQKEYDVFVREALAAAQYQDPEITRQDILEVLKLYPGLKPVIETDVFRMDEQLVLALSGTIPVPVGHKDPVNVSICIWLLNTYPQHAPVIFLNPADATRIVNSQYVAVDGKLTIPYLKDWERNSSELILLLQILIITFQDKLSVNSDCKPSFKPFETSKPTNSTKVANNMQPSKPLCLVDAAWELIDPTPDIHALFITFSKEFFWNRLGSVEVKWSARMTSCAGICSFRPKNRECTITLSQPLLKLRPRKDLVETLLHEMIHAFLFLDSGTTDREGHGDQFHSHMYRINNKGGTSISVYHTFHEEVRHYKTHWWKCNGPCQHKAPFFGLVKRSMNRAPGPSDLWHEAHKKTCGGAFTKIREPEKEVTKKGTSVKKGLQNKKGEPILTPQPSNAARKITDFFPTKSKTEETNKPKEIATIQDMSTNVSTHPTLTPTTTGQQLFPGKGRKLNDGGCNIPKKIGAWF